MVGVIAFSFLQALYFASTFASNQFVVEYFTADRDDGTPVPIVLWHGMGDDYRNPVTTGAYKDFLEKNIPGVYIKPLRIGNSISSDIENSYLMNVNEQVADVCEQLLCDKNLQDGYNAIGLSQGGQFLRAVAQRCPKPRMKNLVTIGAQHQGVYGIPHCPVGGAIQTKWCRYARKLLSYGAYVDLVQKHVVQAEYWHDPLNEEVYRRKSIFLADINNELVKNETYKQNLMQLENIVLIKFLNDSMVVPKESEHFGFYQPSSTSKILSLQNTSLYKEDWLGLKQMDLDGKLHFLSLIGGHLRMDMDWFLQNVVDKFLK